MLPAVTLIKQLLFKLSSCNPHIRIVFH